MKTWHTIVFRSGAKIHFKARNVAVRSGGGQVQSLTVEGARQSFLTVDLGAIAAVWIGRV